MKVPQEKFYVSGDMNYF